MSSKTCIAVASYIVYGKDVIYFFIYVQNLISHNKNLNWEKESMHAYFIRELLEQRTDVCCCFCWGKLPLTAQHKGWVHEEFLLDCLIEAGPCRWCDHW